MSPTSPNRPTIAILASDSSGINLAVAGPSGTASMVVCKGMNSNCSDSANVLLNLSSGALVGERLVFKAAQTVAISSNEVLTVLARDAAGIVKQAATFRLTAR